MSFFSEAPISNTTSNEWSGLTDWLSSGLDGLGTLNTARDSNDWSGPLAAGLAGWAGKSLMESALTPAFAGEAALGLTSRLASGLGDIAPWAAAGLAVGSKLWEMTSNPNASLLPSMQEMQANTIRSLVDPTGLMSSALSAALPLVSKSSVAETNPTHSAIGSPYTLGIHSGEIPEWLKDLVGAPPIAGDISRSGRGDDGSDCQSKLAETGVQGWRANDLVRMIDADQLERKFIKGTERGFFTRDGATTGTHPDFFTNIASVKDHSGAFAGFIDAKVAIEDSEEVNPNILSAINKTIENNGEFQKLGFPVPSDIKPAAAYIPGTSVCVPGYVISPGDGDSYVTSMSLGKR